MSKLLHRLWKLLGTLGFWLGWPAIYLVLKLSKRTRILVTHGDFVLVVKNWLGPNEWSLPGGGLRLGESPATAAARELYEETKVIIDPNDLKPLGEKRINLHGLRLFYYDFYIELPKLIKAAKRSLDIVDSAWFDKHELLTHPVSAATKNALHNWLAN